MAHPCDVIYKLAGRKLNCRGRCICAVCVWGKYLQPITILRNKMVWLQNNLKKITNKTRWVEYEICCCAGYWRKGDCGMKCGEMIAWFQFVRQKERGFCSKVIAVYFAQAHTRIGLSDNLLSQLCLTENEVVFLARSAVKNVRLIRRSCVCFTPGLILFCSIYIEIQVDLRPKPRVSPWLNRLACSYDEPCYRDLLQLLN